MNVIIVIITKQFQHYNQGVKRND